MILGASSAGAAAWVPLAPAGPPSWLGAKLTPELMLESFGAALMLPVEAVSEPGAGLAVTLVRAAAAALPAMPEDSPTAAEVQHQLNNQL